MITDRLRAGGLLINKKRVERLWREAGLGCRKTRKRVRGAALQAPLLAKASAANQRWSLDFLFDRLENGNGYRMLAVIDVFTRECLAIDLARTMGASRVVATLERIAAVRGLPATLSTDNGPEFINTTVQRWARANEVEHSRSRPGTPTDNAFIESFNARLRAECVDLWWTESIREGQAAVDIWRRRYNDERSHSSLGRLTPRAFASSAPWIAFRPLRNQRPPRIGRVKIKSKISVESTRSAVVTSTPAEFPSIPTVP
jgi:putative transposase